MSGPQASRPTDPPTPASAASASAASASAAPSPARDRPARDLTTPTTTTPTTTTPTTTARTVAWLAGTLVGVAGLAAAGVWLTPAGAPTVAWWPAIGGLVGLLVLAPPRLRIPMAFLGGLAATAGSSLAGYPLGAGAALGVANGLEGLVVAALLGRHGAGLTLRTVEDLLRHALAVAALAVGGGAVAGLLAAPFLPADPATVVVGVVLAHGIGIVVVATPLVLYGSGSTGGRAGPVECFAQAGTAVAVTVAVYSPAQALPLDLLVLTPLLWAALRSGPAWTATLTATVSLLVTALTSTGAGPYPLLATGDPLLQVRLVQTTLAGHLVVAIVVAVVVQQRRDAALALRTSQQHTRSVLAAMAEGLVVQDRSGTVVSVNEAAQRLLDVPPDQLADPTALDSRWRAVWSDGSPLPVAESPPARALRGEGPVREVVVGLHRADGGLTWLLVTSVPLVDDTTGTVSAAITTFADVTREQELASRLRAGERQWRAAMDHAPVGMALVAPDGRFLSVNAALERLVGWDAAALVGAPAGTIVHPDETVGEADLAARLVAGEGTVVVDRRYLRSDGETVRAQLSVAAVHDDEGTIRFTVHHVQDVSALREVEERLTHQAMHDALTGLPNRLLLSDRIEHALRSSVRAGATTALLFCDLDGFKRVNDVGGHAHGDEVLREVARRLVHGTRAGDTVARLGGDEFAVLCPALPDSESATAVADRIVQAIAEPFELPGACYEIGVSVGIASVDSADLTAQTLLHRGDLAMYEAKARGKNRAFVFSQEQREDEDRLHELDAQARAALAAGELRVYGQPVVDLQTRGLVGVESLVRWQHPERGLLTPVEWLDVAEASGAMVDIGTWVVAESCRAAVARSVETAEPPVVVHVNVSPRQVDDPGFAASIERALDESGLPGDRLVLELTETHAWRIRDSLGDLVGRLRELGVRLAADDFGTGYSSLAHLADMPVAILKVDRQYVSSMTHSPRSRAVVDSIVGLGRTLGLDVVAEGVETDEQAALLATLGCRLAQGYLFSQPLPVTEALAWSDRRRQAAGPHRPTAGPAPQAPQAPQPRQPGSSSSTPTAEPTSSA